MSFLWTQAMKPAGGVIDFGDGSRSSLTAGRRVAHTYSRFRTFVVTVTPRGRSNPVVTQSLEISPPMQPPATPQLVALADGAHSGDSVIFVLFLTAIDDCTAPTIEFGDGAAGTIPFNGGAVHTYRSAGVYHATVNYDHRCAQ